MAQVKKYNTGTTSGGITTEPDLFEWEGVGKYERKPMVQTLTKNLAAYADYLGLSGDRRTRFLDNGAAAIKALEAGKIRRLANGAYEDSSGGMSSTGKYDKNWLGKLKDTDNNAYNDIAGYFNAYMNKASVYDPEKAKKEAEEKAKKDKTKFSGDTFLQSGLAQKYYAGTFNTSNWFDHRSDSDRRTAIAEYLDSVNYDDIYNKYLWDDSGIDSAETLKARVAAFTQNLKDGKDPDDLDYNTAAALGINLDTFLKKPEEESKEPTSEEQQAAAKEAFIKEKTAAGVMTREQAEQLWNNQQTIQAHQAQQEVDASNAAVADLANSDAFEAWYSAHNNPQNKSKRYTVSGRTAYNPARMKSLMKGKSVEDYFREALSEEILNLSKAYDPDNRLTSARHIINNLDYGVQSGYFSQLDENNYLIPHTFDPNTYTGVVYNPSQGNYQRVSLLSNNAWKDFVKRYYYNSKGWNLPTSNKEGGVLKLLGGGDFFQANYDAAQKYTDDAYAQYLAQTAAEKKAKQQPNPARARDYTRSGEQIEAGKRQVGSPNGEYEWTATDKVRLGTIGADVLSTIASFVPGYGTLASAGLGVASTIGNLGADIADESVSGWQAAGNAALGLGMDLVGLIPGLGVGAKAGKIAKMIKPISKGIVWTLRGIGTAQAYNSIGAINKLMTTPDKMTVDDWRDVAGGVQAVMGFANYRAGKRNVRRNTTQKQVVNIQGADRKAYTISPEDYAKLKSTKGKEAQDKLFKELTGSEKGLAREIKENKKVPFLGWSIPGTGSNPGRTRTQLEWMDAPDAPNWAGWSGYNKGDKWFINHYQGKRFSTGPAKRPSKPAADAKPSSPAAPKRRIIRPLDDYGTRQKVQDVKVKNGRLVDRSHFIRKGELTDAEIKQINNNRKAAGKPALTKEEIDAINTRAANNNATTPGLRERVMQSQRYQERALEQDLARARQEIAEADALAAQKRNNRLPVPYTKDFTRVGSGPVQSPPRPDRTKLLPSGHTITDPTRMLPAPRRIKLVTVPNPISASTIDKNLRINLKTDNGAFIMGRGRSARQADLEAVFGRSAVAKKAAQSRAKNKAAKKSEKSKRQAEFNERQKQREEKKYKTKRGREQAVRKFFNSPEGVAQQNRAQAIIDARAKQKEVKKTVAKGQIKAKQEATKQSKSQKQANNKARRQQQKLTDNLLNNLGYLKSGGLIPKYNGGTTKTGVQRLTGNWYTNIGSAFIDDILKGLSDGTLKYKDINTVANTHSKLRTANPNVNQPTYNKDVEDYYKLINGSYSYINDKGIASGEENNRYKTAAKVDTGDSKAQGWKEDGYFSGKGLDRTPFGYVGDYTDEEFAQAQKKYNDAGYELYDTGDANHAYNIRPKFKDQVMAPDTKPTFVTPSITLPTPIAEATKTPDKTKPKTARAGEGGGTDGGKSGKDWNLLPEDVLAFSRMAMGLGANARAAAQQKAGMKPLITDTWENVVSPEWDYFAQRAGEDAYARLTSLAGRARTANAQDQFAGQLEAENKGNQFIAQGNQQAANRFYYTDELRQQESDAAKARRVENANANTSRMLQIDAAKAQIDAALTTAQYAQVLAPWMAGIENQYRQNRAAQKQMDASAYQRALLAQMQADYDAAVEAGDQKKVKEITDNYYKELAAYNRRAYSSPWLIQRTTQLPASSSYNWIDYAKQGGRLTAREREVIQRAKDFNKRMLEDNKQFHKDIMESKREHNKLIAGMSNLTADLIKNGMKWK